jgi:hypothetical protein
VITHWSVTEDRAWHRDNPEHHPEWREVIEAFVGARR